MVGLGDCLGKTGLAPQNIAVGGCDAGAASQDRASCGWMTPACNRTCPFPRCSRFNDASRRRKRAI